MNTNKKEKFINKNNAVHKRFWQIGIRTFFVFLFVIAFIGLLLPLRPKESELEKRELSKFPKPTVSTVLNGGFFSDISTWYADTFPFREKLMRANASMKKFYGITTQEIYGDAAQGDEIPDADAGFIDLSTSVLFQNNLYLLIFCIIASTPLLKNIGTYIKRLDLVHYRIPYLTYAYEIVIPPVLLILSLLALVGNSYNPFLYFQF